jgi:nicotinamidase-related amidase
MRLPADSYQQFMEPPSPANPQGTGRGWRTIEVDLAPTHTALVVMHAWDAGTPGQYPGWYRSVEYLHRSQQILENVFSPLLAAVRQSPLPVFHVVGGRDYYRHLPGYERTARAAGPSPNFRQAKSDATYEHLRGLRRDLVMPGAANRADVDRGFARLGFASTALPLPTEGIAEDGTQLFALCRAHAINHLIYVGFALNWCLLMSPGGMVDMARHGCLCSTIREAVTAVENHATAESEQEKEQALWRVAVEFGFVFRLGPFLQALKTVTTNSND